MLAGLLALALAAPLKVAVMPVTSGEGVPGKTAEALTEAVSAEVRKQTPRKRGLLALEGGYRLGRWRHARTVAPHGANRGPEVREQVGGGDRTAHAVILTLAWRPQPFARASFSGASPTLRPVRNVAGECPGVVKCEWTLTVSPISHEAT